MPGFIGPTELIVFLAIALLVLGPKKLPEMGRSLGRGMREFKNSVSGDAKHDDLDVATIQVVEDAPAPTAAADDAARAAR